MAPPPEYDKEPKAPDKSATSIPSEDSKALFNLVNEHQTNSDSKSSNSSANAEVENNKHVETLDDGQLRALLDEAITYKCPKDREGKSSLFKELLEEVEQDEQDEQACSAAARLGGGRARRGGGGGRGRRALPHSNSLQDLVAALAAEPAPRRARHAHHPPVSARALHGGSLPSGVDTSFLLSEEPIRGPVGTSAMGGAEYVATVRCVNPSPLAERRVSASDAHTDTDALRRSKPVFPMYTARATLEIGSGSVSSGRAVTTTTASNQVRTLPPLTPGKVPRGPAPPRPRPRPRQADAKSFWDDGACVENWYRGLEAYDTPLDRLSSAKLNKQFHRNEASTEDDNYYRNSPQHSPVKSPTSSIIDLARLNLVSKNKDIPVIAFEATNYSTLDIYSDKPKMLDVKDVEEAMARQAYRERVGKDLVPPSSIPVNPKNVRSLTIGPTLPIKVNTDKCNQNPGPSSNRDKPNKDKNNDKHSRNTRNRNRNANVVIDKNMQTQPADIKSKRYSKMSQRDVVKTRSLSPRKVKSDDKSHLSNESDIRDKIFDKENPRGDGDTPKHDKNLVEMKTNRTSQDNDEAAKKFEAEEKSMTEDSIIRSIEMVATSKPFQTDVDPVDLIRTKERHRNDHAESEDNSKIFEMIISNEKSQNDAEPGEPENTGDTNLIEMVPMHSSNESKTSNEFSLFMANQQRLLGAIESNNNTENVRTNTIRSTGVESSENTNRLGNPQTRNVERPTEKPFLRTVEKALNPDSDTDCFDDKDSETSGTKMDTRRAVRPDTAPADQPGSASYLLTLCKRLLTSSRNIDNTVDIKPTGEAKTPLFALDLDTAAKLPKKKKDKITARLTRKPHSENSNKKNEIIRNALKKLFLDKITQSDCTKLAGTTTKEVDSAIPFSCITSPEVVASCTTTASAQATVAADPKPARSVSAATLNGMPLPRGAHFSTAAAAVAQAAADEFKKSLDENGNSVQGFSSPLSGSSQQKKQRRKKSSKNETVISSHHIDGYQGNKDLNEVLRFIESNEPERPKRHDDKKKRSTERRKDKAQRASSLDDLSRAAPAPARPARPAQPAPKPERRSWGDERQPFYFRDPNPEPDPELTDFQTVTKKRKPRRRADEPSPSPRPPRRAPSPRSPRSPPSPRARSDRSNDSNDDLDSVHSLPALPSRPPPSVSYADIARTKHNIPDLIESCNYYAEGAPDPPAAPEPEPEPEPAPAPIDADGYPALDPRPRRNKAPPPLARKPSSGSEPAPDVVSARPPVILLDSGAPRDLDGVTFGFDIDERLLGARRCDLLAREPAPAPLPAPLPASLPAPAPLPVRAGLRFLQPAAPADTDTLHRLVDYVGTAWEDVVRCTTGKVRYFSE